MGDTQLLAPESGSILSRMGELVQQWQPIIERIPEVGEDGELNIVLAVLSAKTPEEIDAPWNSGGLLDHLDKPITITGIRKGKSDFSDGFGVFLLLDCINAEDGSKYTLTTGSVSVLAQCFALFGMDAFPRTVIPRAAARPSANGYTPIHLELVRS